MDFRRDRMENHNISIGSGTGNERKNNIVL
jgi:hypothetical protein